MQDAKLYSYAMDNEFGADKVDEERSDQVVSLKNDDVDESPAVDASGDSTNAETETERTAKRCTGPLYCVWMFLNVAGILSFVFTSSIYSRVNPSNCNVKLYRQSAALIAQSHNASNWYFRDWGLISGQGFCPLEHFQTRTTSKGKKYAVYQDCFDWTSSVWSNWDKENESNGLGKN